MQWNDKVKNKEMVRTKKTKKMAEKIYEIDEIHIRVDSKGNYIWRETAHRKEAINRFCLIWTAVLLGYLCGIAHALVCSIVG